MCHTLANVVQAGQMPFAISVDEDVEDYGSIFMQSSDGPSHDIGRWKSCLSRYVTLRARAQWVSTRADAMNAHGTETSTIAGSLLILGSEDR